MNPIFENMLARYEIRTKNWVTGLILVIDSPLHQLKRSVCKRADVRFWNFSAIIIKSPHCWYNSKRVGWEIAANDAISESA
jgi:hypothetical protein